MDDEFLITNQLGGYASSTFHNGNTRKYHGLLVAANENLDRKVILSQVEEKININDQDRYFSTAAFYPDVVSPNGSLYLSQYSLRSSTICTEYNIGSVHINKEISLAQEANSVILRYQISTLEKIKLVLSPLITDRINHKLLRFSNASIFKTKIFLNNARIELSDFEELTMKVLYFNPRKLINVSYTIKPCAQVYQNFYFREEAKRGLEDQEDLIKPFEVSFDIEPGENFVSLQFGYNDSRELLPSKANNALKLVYNLDYQKTEIKHTPLIEFKDFLLERYHDFLVDNNYRKTIIAGYHWFADWGRDTFISFPGMLLATGEYKFGYEVINHWSQFIKDGLIPNSLSNKAYNSIDASLWLIICMYRYYQATKDKAALKIWYPRIRNLILELINGSSFSITVNGDGFLIWDDPEYNLTWMDSMADGKSTTGRIGACVEIEMLWYNCLRIFEFCLKELDIEDQQEEITSLSKKVFQKFNKEFWNPGQNYVYDFIDGHKADASIRPNVILGMALPFKLFDKRKTEKILDRVRKDLYTEVGVMTLNKTDIKYNGSYSGTQKERDKAYHNGTIWPYLLGFYLKAVMYAYPKDNEKKQQVKNDLITFWKEIKARKLSYLPEVFAANDLHADGCLSQAWNYALFLEVYQLLN